MKTVFVLVYEGTYDYECHMSVGGVFNKISEAQEKMKEEFKSSLQVWRSNYYDEDIESSISMLSAYIQTPGDWSKNHEQWEIFEQEVKE